MRKKVYDREAAVAYAEKWALGRNPEYYSFSGIGGDCTNFVSQCIYAGCGIMNYTPVTGWYYRSASDRTASWTGVRFLYNFLIGNKGPGPYGEVAGKSDMMPGDIIQLGKADGMFYHSLFVIEKTADDILIATHTYDALRRPLSTYIYDRARYIHIVGARI
ncbi:MAG: amidase domain-containing protein [Oscillospiraceae bacterium]|jgi:hypothetical protein